MGCGSVVDEAKVVNSSKKFCKVMFQAIIDRIKPLHKKVRVI